MKKNIVSALVIALFFTSCKQTETKVETAENPDGTVTTTTIETQKSTNLDSAKVNATVDQAKEKLNLSGEKIDAAADKAGEKLKEAAAKGAEKIEDGAAKAKEDLQKKIKSKSAEIQRIFYWFKSNNGSIYSRSLLSLGTLFCPPNFPRSAIHL